MSNEYEDKNVEYKQEYSDKIRRAVVAFANTNGGKIYVGIDDFGSVVGVKDVEDVKRRIAKLLRSGVLPDVSPYVDYTTEKADGRLVVGLEVQRGPARPYWLAEKGLNPDGVLLRVGSLNSPASDAQIAKLIREANDGGRYEEARALDQDLSFRQAADLFTAANLTLERRELRALGLVDAWGAYANLAYLISDRCGSTIRIAIQEEEDDDRLKERIDLSGSIFKQFEDACSIVDKQNKKFVKTRGGVSLDAREYRELPPKAVREALANAVVHRDYSFGTPTLVRICSDRLEVVSRGGLVDGATQEDLQFGVFAPRNPNLSGLFARLHAIDGCGLGLRRIRRLYEDGPLAPKIEATREFFKVTLYKTFERKALREENADSVEMRVSRYSPIRISVDAENL